MFTKLLVVLAVVCVVKASVYTDNVFNENPDTEVASNPRQCIPSNCKQQCRRQGFANGYCVAGQCRCTALKTQENVPEADIARNPLKCDDAACNRKCRNKGFARGGCYLGRCKCRR
ncbi:hypothetical protein PYW08_015206 [Mythimna loreyi]|uniref:Uncharacterized protein n=1 Tax=Mythimna loreyi TaxID=667449 RepID=A0ACC2R056_9NEOP|nr:hypothetical protein PYW08_015206 [Mythimna loreyi]